MHLVVIFAACHIFYGKSCADLDAFDSTNAKHPAQLGVEFMENRFAEAYGGAGYDDFNYTAG
ncbi:hypothetical protein ES703_92190 [subsurface metagenome]